MRGVAGAAQPLSAATDVPVGLRGVAGAAQVGWPARALAVFGARAPRVGAFISAGRSGGRDIQVSLAGGAAQPL